MVAHAVEDERSLPLPRHMLQPACLKQFASNSFLTVAHAVEDGRLWPQYVLKE